MPIAQELEDSWQIALATTNVAQVVREEGDFAVAREIYADAERQFDALGDEHYALLASVHVAWMNEELGEKEGALALHEENLLRARAASTKRIEWVTLYNIARFARMDGRFGDAMAMTDVAYRIIRDIGEAEVADSISRFASILAYAGKAETAVRVLSCSEVLREELGVRRSWMLERNEETLEIIRAGLDETAFDEAWEQGRKLTPDEAVALARDAFDGT